VLGPDDDGQPQGDEMRTHAHYLPRCSRRVRILNHPKYTGLYGVVTNATQRAVEVRLNVTGEVIKVHPLLVQEVYDDDE
jgi:hypothetical protein